MTIRKTTAFGYRPEGQTEYLLQVTTFHNEAGDYSVENLRFADKPAAIAHAKAIGAVFTC